MPSKLKFHHVAIKFKKIDKAVKFFTKKLGFKTISVFVTKVGKKVICLEKDHFILEVFETFGLIEEGGFLKHLAFEVKNINQVVKDLKKKDIKFIEGPTRSRDEDGKVFYFAYFWGPESIKLELHQEGGK